LALDVDTRDLMGSLAPAGTLARGPLFGASPRPVIGNVTFADWSPADGQLAAVVIGARERLEWR
jgi:hypothetical protein